MARLDRLIRCLELTTSSHDGEALAAIRKANEELARIGVGWDALVATTDAELTNHVRVTVDAKALDDPKWPALIWIFRWLRRSPYLTPDEGQRLQRIEAAWAIHGILLSDQMAFIADMLRRSRRVDLIRDLRK